MVGSPNRDRLAERREATRNEILATAWQIARDDGLASLTLREIAARIGMRPPSLYSHFESKNAIYDAMFAQAWREFHAVLVQQVATFPPDPRGSLLALATTYFDFAVSDMSRHQLMDVPMLSDFAPSSEAYQPSLDCYGILTSVLAAAGLRKQADLDLYTALVGGLVNQQLANDPKGDRWRALLPRAIAMLADDLGLPTQPRLPVRRKK
jgi:AcrR family transcriptional regulator